MEIHLLSLFPSHALPSTNVTSEKSPTDVTSGEKNHKARFILGDSVELCQTLQLKVTQEGQ